MSMPCFPPTPCPVCISRRLSHSSDLPPSVLCRLHYHNIPREQTLKRTLPHGRGNDTDADVTTDRVQRSLSAQNRRYKTGHADKHWKNMRNASNKYELIKNDILRRGLTDGLYSTLLYYATSTTVGNEIAPNLLDDLLPLCERVVFQIAQCVLIALNVIRSL